MTTKYKLLLVFLYSIFTVLLTSCRKFVEIQPPETQLVSATVFTSDATAESAISGIYSRMISSSGFASGASNSVTFLCGLSSDELTSYSSAVAPSQFYNNALLATNTILPGALWGEPYTYVYSANAILQGLSNSTGVTQAVNRQLTGEAKFIRAFCLFYLTNLYGDIPLPLTTDYTTNNSQARTPSADVYNRVIADLVAADSLLVTDYSASNGERVRPNKWAADALLARAYLYTKQYPEAETFSTAVINQSPLFGLVQHLDSAFLANSQEAIWQLKPNKVGYNTNEGQIFILTGRPTLAALTSTLVNSFEPGDLRRSYWVDSVKTASGTYYYPFKYKIRSGATVTEYSMVLRLAEQYLIRAEARAIQGKLAGADGAASDLNAIRRRAGLPATTATDETDMLDAIAHERQVELFTEWAHRWLDLKRTLAADSVLGTVKAPKWQSTDALYPIPQIEIQNDPNITQNTGY